MGKKRPIGLRFLCGGQSSQTSQPSSVSGASSNKRSRSGEPEPSIARNEPPSQPTPHHLTRSVTAEGDGSSQQLNVGPMPEPNRPEHSSDIEGFQSQHKMRGPTRMGWVWNMPPGETIEVPLNANGVPYTEEGRVLSSFIGVLVRNGHHAPICIPRWTNDAMRPYVDNLIRLVKTKFTIPDAGNPWLRKSLNKRWRDWKTDLKTTYNDPLLTKEEIMEKVPPGVIKDQWHIFVNNWFTDKNKEISTQNSDNAKKKTNVHTSGRKSYVRLSAEIEKASGKPPDRLTLYDITHKRSDGSYISEEARDSWIRHMLYKRNVLPLWKMDL